MRDYFPLKAAKVFFSNPLTRRALLAAVLACTAALLSMNASAQGQWPNRPIKLIVPFAPGGSNDTIARVLAEKLGSRLGQPIIVDNRGGGGGTIGTDLVAKSPPDGYTLLLVSTSITTNAAAGKKLPYDPVNDFQPIGEVAAAPFVIVVANDVKAATLGELIALARAKPKSINYGSAGTGGMNHLTTELFASTAKIELTHVPYKGISLAFTDLIGGSLQMLMPTVASATPYIHSGKMRGIAVTGNKRSPLAPELPTTAEAGLANYEPEVWWGLLGPAKLPAPIVKRLNEELNAVLALPDVRDLFAREGATPHPGTPEALGKLIRSELARWGKLIKEAKIQIE